MPWIPRDLYVVLLAKLQEPTPAPVVHVTAPTLTATNAAPVVQTPVVPTPPPPTVITLGNGTPITVPDAVVSACVREARGNSDVLDRQLHYAARRLASGEGAEMVTRDVLAGELLEV